MSIKWSASLTLASPPQWRQWRGLERPTARCHNGIHISSTLLAWQPPLLCRSLGTVLWKTQRHKWSWVGIKVRALVWHHQGFWEKKRHSWWLGLTCSPSAGPWTHLCSRRIFLWRAELLWQRRWTWRGCKRWGCWARSSESWPRSRTPPGDTQKHTQN